MSSLKLKDLPSFEALPPADERKWDLPEFAGSKASDASEASALARQLTQFDKPVEAAPHAELPRAEIAPDSTPAPTPTEVETESVATAQPVEETVESPAMPDSVAPNVAPVDTTQLDMLVAEFAGSLTALRADFQSQVDTTVLRIVDALLPALAREFIAEEIVRHVPTLIPDRIFGVEIQAGPELAEKLNALFEQENRLPANAIVRPIHGKADNSVSLNWGEGGYDFEFEPLLARCRQRLIATQSE